MPDRRRLGSSAEDQAAEYLLKIGYTLITRGFKRGRGEIDLIALDGDTLVFVEVKNRILSEQTPEEAVGREKIERLADAARCYLSDINRPEATCRFDVIAIDLHGLRHYPSAFEPD